MEEWPIAERPSNRRPASPRSFYTCFPPHTSCPTPAALPGPSHALPNAPSPGGAAARAGGALPGSPLPHRGARKKGGGRPPPVPYGGDGPTRCSQFDTGRQHTDTRAAATPGRTHGEGDPHTPRLTPASLRLPHRLPPGWPFLLSQPPTGVYSLFEAGAAPTSSRRRVGRARGAPPPPAGPAPRPAAHPW